MHRRDVARAFATAGMDGLHDAPRSGRPLKHSAEVWQQIQTRVCEQPAAYGRWSVRTLAGSRPAGLHGAFSNKVENHAAAIALYFIHHNLAASTRLFV